MAWVAGSALIVMADGLGGLPFGGEAAEAATDHAFRRLRRELPSSVRSALSVPFILRKYASLPNLYYATQ